MRTIKAGHEISMLFNAATVARLFLILAATLPRCAAGQATPDLQKAINTALYRVEPQQGSYAAFNSSQHLKVRFAGGRSEFDYQGSGLRLSLENEGPVLGSVAEGNRVRFEHARVTEWFLNTPAGIEQGFTVSSRKGSGKLVLTLATSGALTPALSGKDIVFLDGKTTALRYGGLHSEDADGRVLPSRAMVEGRRIRLEVDDSGARYPITVDPVLQQAALTPAGNAGYQAAAVALSADGNTALVGDLSYLAFVFTRSGTTWSEQQQLSDNQQYDGFGNAVALSADGNTALVGSRSAAYVYTRTGTTWDTSSPAVLTATGSIAFGSAVALSSDGNTALIGAAGTNNDAGAVYFFKRSGNTWTQQQPVVTANDSTDQDQFGGAVALSGDGKTAMVGASQRSLSAGAVYVYTLSANVWTFQKELTPQDAVNDNGFGSAIALSSDGTTALIGARSRNTYTGTAYVFTGSGSSWTQQQELTASDLAQGSNFGGSVALNGAGTLALVGFTASSSATNVYLFARTGNSWAPAQEVPPSMFSGPVALNNDGSTALLGAYVGPGHTDAYVYSFSDIGLLSVPSGRGFTLTGTGCPTGTFTTPYSGFWSGPCSVQWVSPDLQTAGTRYTFQYWSDSNTSNPRLLTPQPLSDPTLYSYSANFLTEYQLTTMVSPSVGGQVSPQTGTWFTAGTDAQLVPMANAGFVFTGFSGALSGETSPQVLAMNSPETVTANFTSTPAATQSAVVSSKSGPANARQWTITITNSGPGTAYNLQFAGLIFNQTFGTACTPVRDTPLLPAALGDVPVNSAVQQNVTLDFSSCPANARFTVNIIYLANGGSSGGLIQLANQFQ
jgi:hypothetical protein